MTFSPKARVETPAQVALTVVMVSTLANGRTEFTPCVTTVQSMSCATLRRAAVKA